MFLSVVFAVNCKLPGETWISLETGAGPLFIFELSDTCTEPRSELMLHKTFAELNLKGNYLLNESISSLYSSDSQPRVILFSRGHLVTSGDIWGCYKLGGGGYATGI